MNRSALNIIIDTLGDDEVRVLARIADRLAMGQRCYGRLDLATDSRDFRQERREEIEDMLVYSAMAELRALARD